MRPREGGLQWGKNFWLRLLQPACNVCVSLTAFFILDIFKAKVAICVDDEFH